MKNVIDWLKLTVMVVMGLVWIVISDYSEFAQILGMLGFLCSAFVWATSAQAAKLLNNLID
jgi:hypothetical protein